MKNKFVLKFTIALIVFMILWAALNIVVDPFYHYHAPADKSNEYMYNAVYQTTGAAANFQYDMAIVGTSLCENFRASWFDEAGYNCEKLTYPSATLRDYGVILSSVFESDNDVRMIVTDISDIQLNAEVGSRRTTEADYLNNDSLLDDYNYIWNLDVTKQSLYRIYERVTGSVPNHDENYTWENPEFFSEEACKRDTCDNRAAILDETARGVFTPFDGNTVSPFKDNLAEITSIIEAHPETQFNIFIPPFSILYWELQELQGRTDWILAVYRDTVTVLSSYDNVTVYSFIDEEEVITNLDLYRDSGHYNPDINHYICDAILSGRNIVDESNIDEHLDNMRRIASEYDYDSVWNH